MNYLKILNTVAIGIPIILALIGVFDESFLMMALVSTMATGFIQVIVGILFWIKEWENFFIILYLVGVILFFMGISLTNSDSFWIMPPILCIYLSLLVYTQKN
ncbi:hypothetical protein [Flavobacterium sp.]|uniref:hypothetical protein n=1 Tax=Flavobacterium sp. TaxID=239 RepID=UPI00352713AD